MQCHCDVALTDIHWALLTASFGKMNTDRLKAAIPPFDRAIFSTAVGRYPDRQLKAADFPMPPMQYKTTMLDKMHKIVFGALSRARPGGHICNPHRFFADSIKMAARSAAKFGITVHLSFANLV